jgi:hypothetical protein
MKCSSRLVLEQKLTSKLINFVFIYQAILLDAGSKLSTTITQLQSTTTKRTATTPPNNKGRVFLHWQYHPNDIPRKVMRILYNEHLEHETSQYQM